MGRAAKMAIPEYQGEVQAGANKQDMSKGGPKQVARKSGPKPSSSFSPRGVGMARKPPLWLQPGDVIEVQISQIGTLSNGVCDGE
jgi:hypothetical protein